MNNFDWVQKLPNNPCQKRDNLILEAVQNGMAYCCWVPIISTHEDYKAIFYVCDDAIRVDLDDGKTRFRIPVSANLAQQCADILDVSLTTAKINDLSYHQAQIIVGMTALSPTSDMATIIKSKKWNELIELKRNNREGLFRDCGKTWILDNALSRSAGAINYGFYDKSAPSISPGGLKLWQSIGTKHNAQHTDYSQILLLMKKTCEVNGNLMQVIDVMNDKKLSLLLNYNGTLQFTRQPT